MSYVEGELKTGKPTEVPENHSGHRPVPKPRNSAMASKHSMAEAAEHSLQVVADEFKMIHEPKNSTLKGRYSANATLIFNIWLKAIDMYVYDNN